MAQDLTKFETEHLRKILKRKKFELSKIKRAIDFHIRYSKYNPLMSGLETSKEKILDQIIIIKNIIKKRVTLYTE